MIGIDSILAIVIRSDLIDVIPQQFPLLLRAVCLITACRRTNDQTMDSSANEFETSPESTAAMSEMTVVDTTSGDEVQITLRDEQPVAKGGWSTVSKASLSNGDVVAVKRIRESSHYKVLLAVSGD